MLQISPGLSYDLSHHWINKTRRCNVERRSQLSPLKYRRIDLYRIDLGSKNVLTCVTTYFSVFVVCLLQSHWVHDNLLNGHRFRLSKPEHRTINSASTSPTTPKIPKPVLHWSWIFLFLGKIKRTRHRNKCLDGDGPLNDVEGKKWRMFETFWKSCQEWLK